MLVELGWGDPAASGLRVLGGVQFGLGDVVVAGGRGQRCPDLGVGQPAGHGGVAAVISPSGLPMLHGENSSPDSYSPTPVLGCDSRSATAPELSGM